MERDERRFEQKECMKHQDLAIAIGYARIEGTFKTLCRTSECPEYLWRNGNPETGEGRGIPLLYTGNVCPVCNPGITAMIRVRETTEKYRLMRRGHYDDGYGQHR